MPSGVPRSTIARLMKSSSSHFVHLTYIAAQPLGPRDSYRYVSLTFIENTRHWRRARLSR